MTTHFISQTEENSRGSKLLNPKLEPLLTQAQQNELDGLLSKTYPVDPYKRFARRFLNQETIKVINAQSSAAPVFLETIRKKVIANQNLNLLNVQSMSQAVDRGKFIVEIGGKRQEIPLTQMNPEQLKIVVSALREAPVEDNAKPLLSNLASVIESKNAELPTFAQLESEYQVAMRAFEKKLAEVQTVRALNQLRSYDAKIGYKTNGEISVAFPIGRDGKTVAGVVVDPFGDDVEVTGVLQRQILEETFSIFGVPITGKVNAVLNAGNIGEKTTRTTTRVGDRVVGRSVDTDREWGAAVGVEGLLEYSIPISKDVALTVAGYAQQGVGVTGSGVGTTRFNAGAEVIGNIGKGSIGGEVAGGIDVESGPYGRGGVVFRF